MKFECVDALTFLRNLPDQSVDAVITDPPYETTSLHFDQQTVNWPALWAEILRVAKPHAPIVMFAAGKFTPRLIMSNEAIWRYNLVWEKTLAGRSLDANRRPLATHEDIVVFCQNGYGTYNPQKTTGHPRKVGGGNDSNAKQFGQHLKLAYDSTERHPTSVLKFANGHGGQETLHPTQKPVDLMRWLVRTYSNPNDVVLDPFSGSGSTGVAAIIEGRQFCGCEFDAEYHRKALKRLESTAIGLFSI